MIAWKIEIDWGRNNVPTQLDDFTGPYDNVSNRVLQVNWFLGMRKPYQELADNSLAAIILNNVDRLYSPDSPKPIDFDGEVAPQRPVRITSFDGTTKTIHWIGWVEAIQPEVNKFGKRIVKILASGAMQFYKAAETQLELQEDKRTDEVISALLTEVIIPPAVNKSWIVGREESSQLGITTYLVPDESAYSVVEQGKVLLGMAADNWVIDGGFSDTKKNTFDVYRAIGDITSAEHGRFFFNREGKAVFWNRHHLLQGSTSQATFDDSMTEMTYSFAGLEECKNEIIVICHPRTISDTADEVLWELGESVIRVDPAKPRKLYVKYEDENDKRVGAREVTVHDLEFDNKHSAGTATVTVAEKANGAELTFTCVGNHDAVVTKCVLKGRKIVDAGEIEAKAVDMDSIIDYGRRTMRVNLPSIDNVEQAQYIADFERTRRSKPRGMVQALTVLSHGKNGGLHQQQQLNLSIGSMITVKETQTGHDSTYYVIGEAHELTHGASLWKTSWYLEPTPKHYPWRLPVGSVDNQRSNLGASTRLTY